jgi:MYXO-CTERM domain-containing protein
MAPRSQHRIVGQPWEPEPRGVVGTHQARSEPRRDRVKANAREIYDETVWRRRDPGLLEEIGPGRYSLEVFPIEPRERKRVQVEWTQWLDQHAGEVSLRTPLVDPDAEIVVGLDDDRGIRDFRSSTHRVDMPDGVAESGRAGCAHCAVDEGPGATPWLLVAIVLRRRRRLTSVRA